MKKYLTFFCLVLLMNASCVEDEPDILGDILVRILLDEGNTVPDGFIFGVFPTEVLITKEFTRDNAIKTASMEEGQALITDMMPGIYVISNLSSNTDTFRKTAQVLADEVTLVDFDYRRP